VTRRRATGLWPEKNKLITEGDVTQKCENNNRTSKQINERIIPDDGNSDCCICIVVTIAGRKQDLQTLFNFKPQN